MAKFNPNNNETLTTPICHAEKCSNIKGNRNFTQLTKPDRVIAIPLPHTT